MNGSGSPTLRILILAAGYSRRLGQPKALARVRAHSLLRRTVVVLAPLSRSKLIAVVPPRAARLRAELRGLDVALRPNARRALGQSSSVRAGLLGARYAAAVLLVPVDLARLEARELARMILRWRGARRRVVARRIGKHAAAPLILPKWLFGRARQIAGDVGLRDFVRRLPPNEVLLVQVASASQDIDTREDLARARRHAAAAPGNPQAMGNDTSR
jgi:molybdenum cofactor cytidylyltransferase